MCSLNAQVLDKRALIAELKSTRDLERGKTIHAEAIKSGNDSCIYVVTALVRMYAKCGNMAEARRVFERMKHRDVVLWNALIVGYAENGESHSALDLFSRMTCRPNTFTFVAAAKACTSLASGKDGSARVENLKRAKQVHSRIGFCSNVFVINTLIDMYAKCGSIVDARQVFDSMPSPVLVSWNTLILGYAENGEGVTALDLFERMKSEGCPPDTFTFVAALKACTSLALEHRAEFLERGKQIHSEVGCHSNMYVHNTLIDMYAKFGTMQNARQVFDSIKSPDLISWNSIILGYAENGEGTTALDLFARMKAEGYVPDSSTFVSALKACGLVGALESGRKVHSDISMEIVQGNVILVNCLVDFYAKCGSLVEAQNVVDSHPTARDLTTWTALLAGYSRLGDAKSVFRLFKVMQDAGFQPNGVTFLCILTCCSQAGFFEQANEFFEAMSTIYGITRTLEHYNCMVDILGRSNKLDNCMALLHCIPCTPDAVTWMIVLSACAKWKNVGIGCLAFESLVSIQNTDAAAYVVMAHIFKSKGMWEEHDDMVLRMRIC